MEDFLQAVLESRRNSLQRRQMLSDMEQRVLDRTMREKEINAQMSHQQAVQELARQQFEESKRRSQQDDAFRVAQGIASGQFFDARPQTVTPGRGGAVEANIAPPSGNTLAERLGPPSLRPSVPMLPEAVAPSQTIAPPGNPITIGGVPLVPVNPEVQQARALRSATNIAEAEGQARAKGQAAAAELQRKGTMQALDAFVQTHPEAFRDDPDRKTDMYLWAAFGKQPKDESMYTVMGDALKTIARGGPPEKIKAAYAVLNAFGGTRAPQASPSFAREVSIDNVASKIYGQVLGRYKQKDGSFKFPTSSQDVYKDMLAEAAAANLPEGYLMPVAEAARKLLVTEKKPNFLDTLLAPKQ